MKKMLAGILASVMLCSAGAVGMTASAATDTSGIELDIQNGLIYRIKAGTTLAEVKAEMAKYANEYFDYALTSVKDDSGRYVANTAVVSTGLTGYMYTPKHNTFTLSVIGDVDGNGIVNVSDQMTLKNLIMDGYSDGYTAKFRAADVNGDGKLDTSDMMALKNLIMAG